MPDTLPLIRPGARVQVHSPGFPTYPAIVDETMPQFQVAWIRDLRTGDRKMLCTDEHCLSPGETRRHPHPLHAGAVTCSSTKQDSLTGTIGETV